MKNYWRSEEWYPHGLRVGEPFDLDELLRILTRDHAPVAQATR
jgi:hypothetical protein